MFGILKQVQGWLKIKGADGTVADVVDDNGVKRLAIDIQDAITGPQGPQGDQGPQGVQGPQGDPGPAVELQDEGVSLTTGLKKLNFIGDGVTAAEQVPDEIDITITDAGHIIQEEGTPLPQRGNLNFGPGFAVVDDSGNDATNVDLNLSELGLDADLAGAQGNRTTSLVVPGTATAVTFDTTDVEIDDTVVEHNNTTTSRFYLYEMGNHLAYINLVVENTSNQPRTLRLQLYKNGTAIPSTQIDFVLGAGVSDAITRVIQLNNATGGDYYEVYLTDLGATGNITLKAGTRFGFLRLSGKTGAQGPQGPAGSGSSINLKEGGVPVVNTPHTDLNFDGNSFNVVDNGDGSVTITAVGSIFGNGFQYAESDIESSTTSATYQQKLKLTTPSLASGNYIVQWAAEVRTTDQDMLIRCQLDDTTLINEHKHSTGTNGPDGTSTYFTSVGGFKRVALNGIHNVDIDYHNDGGGTAFIKRVRIMLWRVS